MEKIKKEAKGENLEIKESVRGAQKLPFDVRYIQRLKIPTGRFSELGKGFGPFGAGGGGFNPKAYKMLAKVFEFDYMGSAEFEYGQVPKAFAKIYSLASEGKISKGSLDISGTKVFYLCQDQFEGAVEAAIKKLANNKIRTKAPVMLKESLGKKAHRPGEVAGWIEIENNFIFFIDEKMFEGTSNLFKVK